MAFMAEAALMALFEAFLPDQCPYKIAELKEQK